MSTTAGEGTAWGAVRRLRVPFRYLLGSTVAATFVLMLLGAYTKAVGAGLACPDWPRCYGVWVPFLHPELLASSDYAGGFSGLQIFVEWAHRGLAMIVGLMIVASTGVAWRKERNKTVVWSLVVALALLPTQILLGGLTVTRRLEPVIVTAHLGTATLIILALTVATTVEWYER